MWGVRQKSVQDLFRLEREDWIENCRQTARHLLTHGKESITIDDVLVANPRPKYIHPNASGHVFRSGDFACIGHTKSRQKSRRGSIVGIWVLRGAR